MKVRKRKWISVPRCREHLMQMLDAVPNSLTIAMLLIVSTLVSGAEPAYGADSQDCAQTFIEDTTSGSRWRAAVIIIIDGDLQNMQNKTFRCLERLNQSGVFTESGAPPETSRGAVPGVAAGAAPEGALSTTRCLWNDGGELNCRPPRTGSCPRC
jgi:hypothetical protein